LNGVASTYRMHPVNRDLSLNVNRRAAQPQLSCEQYLRRFQLYSEHVTPPTAERFGVRCRRVGITESGFPFVSARFLSGTLVVAESWRYTFFVLWTARLPSSPVLQTNL